MAPFLDQHLCLCETSSDYGNVTSKTEQLKEKNTSIKLLWNI